MLSSLTDWWSDQNPWLRYGVAIGFLAISTILYFCGYLWPWGWGVGIALLIFGGPSDSEKKGYRF